MLLSVVQLGTAGLIRSVVGNCTFAQIGRFTRFSLENSGAHIGVMVLVVLVFIRRIVVAVSVFTRQFMVFCMPSCASNGCVEMML